MNVQPGILVVDDDPQILELFARVLRAQGYRVICVPAPGLIHAECQSRPGVVRFEERYRFFERWADLLRRPDPHYSPSLAPTEKIALNLSDEERKIALPKCNVLLSTFKIARTTRKAPKQDGLRPAGGIVQIIDHI